MTISTLIKDATRVHVSLEYRSSFTGRRCQKKANHLRDDILARILGPRFPGFQGKNMAEVDDHIQLLADCSTGRNGRALQLALQSYSSLAYADEKLAALMIQKRPSPAKKADLHEDAGRNRALLQACMRWYELATSLHGMPRLNVIPPIPVSYDAPLRSSLSLPQWNSPLNLRTQSLP